jgi:hypothetical protein
MSRSGRNELFGLLRRCVRRGQLFQDLDGSGNAEHRFAQLLAVLIKTRHFLLAFLQFLPQLFKSSSHRCLQNSA